MSRLGVIFWNPHERRPRLPWRLLLQTALMAALAAVPILLIAEPLTALHKAGRFLPGYGPDAYDRIVNLIVGPMFAVAVIASTLIARRWIDRRPVRSLGVRIDGKWWAQMGMGAALGFTLMAGVFAVELLAGWVRITGWLAVQGAASAGLAAAIAYSLVKAVCVGHYEEFLSRGYHLRNLEEGLGLGWAVVLSSSVFAVLHVINGNASVLSTVGLFVNGLMFAAAAVVTGRLAMPIGLHMAWNFAQGAVFGFPVSGDKETGSLIAIAQGGPAWITGGAFGPEAGLMGIAASVVGAAVVIAIYRRRAPAP